MSGYVKIYGSILGSSVWSETPTTRIVWITLLAMADQFGHVEASVSGLARFANVSTQECRKALAALSAPDPDSKSPEFEGRRVEKWERGWTILNYLTYREMRTPKQVADAERQATRREENPTGCVYYAQDGDLVKIGYSTNPWARVAEMRTARPAMQLVASERGGMTLEKDRHAQFGHLRTSEDGARGREWFFLKDDLLRHVDVLRSQSSSQESHGVAPSAVLTASAAATGKKPPRRKKLTVTTLEAGEIINRIRALQQRPPQGTAFIPRPAVEAFGSDVLRAYDAIGGAKRFTKDDDYVLLHFSRALSEAREV